MSLNIKRSVIFGPLQAARLSGYSAAVDEISAHLKLPKAHLRDIVFGSLIQAGADSIETLLHDKDELPRSSFLRKRIVPNMRPEWAQSFLLIHSVFEPLRMAHQADQAARGSIFLMQTFLVELLYAIHRGQPMALMSEMPDPKALDGKIPAELQIAVSNLFSTFIPVSPEVATPCTSIGARDVAFFQQILTSRLFDDYKASHSALSKQNISPDLSLEKLQRITERICKTADNLVRPRRMQAFLLPLMGKGIEVLFGSLPAAIAEQCRALIEPHIDPNRRIIIYQLRPITSRTLGSLLRGAANHALERPAASEE